MTIEQNIIHTHVTLSGEADMNEQDDQDFSMEDLLDDKFESFLLAIAEDGLNTTRDTYFNGMQAAIDILNAVYDDQNPEVSILDAIALIEDSLASKSEEGEIDLSYGAEEDEEDEDADGLYDSDELPDDDDDEDEDEDDDSFED